MKVLAYILSILSLLFSIMLPLQLKNLTLLVFCKLAAGALAPIWALLGIAGAALGWASGAWLATTLGVIGAATMVWHIAACARGHDGFERAFGPDWARHMPPERARQLLPRRWMGYLRMSAPPGSSFEQDVVYHTVSGSGRDLLCDVWRPASDTVSGLGIVFLHGGSWTSMDKDFGTRPLFSHLVAQGHTIMDVAFRLCPEVDLQGMMGDIKRAVAWLKEHAQTFGVQRDKIVLVGSSTGGHLALLSAYAPDHDGLTPPDLSGTDLSVCGVVSFYGPTDLALGHEQWKIRERARELPALPIGSVLDPKQSFRYAGRLDMLLGGHPKEAPEAYALAAPGTHVGAHCPPTLLVQGDRDVLVAVDATRAFHEQLSAQVVPAVNVILPCTEHGFDLILPQINPAAHSALYDLDRFLAMLESQR